MSKLYPWATQWRFARSHTSNEWVLVKTRKHDAGEQYHLYEAVMGPVIFGHAYEGGREMRAANDNVWRVV